MSSVESHSGCASPGPRRILFFDHTAVLGGGEIALLNLIQHLDASRYRATVVLASEGPLVGRLLDAGVETIILPIEPAVARAKKDGLGVASLLRFREIAMVVAYAWKLSHFIRKRGFDLVHTNSLKSDIIGGMAARLARVPLLWHVRDRIADDYLPGSVVRAFRILCRLVPNYVVTNSASTLSTVPHKAAGSLAIPSGLVLPRGQSRVVHDGLAVVSPRPPFSGERTMIGIIGRISPWKGQHIFLEAASRVLARFPQASFQIIGSALFGEDEYERRVRQLTRDLGLDKVVEFTGFRTDIPELLSQLDVLVHASTTGEPFGQVVAEGMMAGKPVVATRGGGVPEIMLDGITGFLVPMNDSVAMADAICQLLADPRRARAMGRRGRARVLSEFTIQRTVDRIQRVYEQMLN